MAMGTRGAGKCSPGRDLCSSPTPKAAPVCPGRECVCAELPASGHKTAAHRAVHLGKGGKDAGHREVTAVQRDGSSPRRPSHFVSLCFVQGSGGDCLGGFIKGQERLNRPSRALCSSFLCRSGLFLCGDERSVQSNYTVDIISREIYVRLRGIRQAGRGLN